MGVVNPADIAAGKNTGKRLLWDARTRLLLACAAIPAAIETAYLYATGEANDVTLLFALLAIVCSLLMALLPSVGGWAIVALWAARCVVPQTTPFSILFCLLMAVTIMTYLHAGMALAAAVIAEMATASRIWLYPWDSSVFTIVCATAAFLMVALWLGSMMSWRERQEIEARERAELLHELADQELATQLHHSVANDLTTILLLARQLESDAVRRETHGETDASEGIGVPNGGQSAPMHDSGLERANPIGRIDEAETISLIERTATESLAKIRTLIAGLDHADGSPVTTDSHTGIRPAPKPDPGIGSETAQGVMYNGIAAPTPAVAPSANRPSWPRRAGTASSSVPPARIASLTADELRELGESADARLHANGLVGETIIGGAESSTCTDERKAALLDILHEIVGNMMKYADPDAGYCIAVTLGPGLATVSASNGIGSNRCGRIGQSLPDGSPDAGSKDSVDVAACNPLASVLTGGTGIARCRQAAESAGGEFTASAEEGTWTCLLKLPLI
ncbi:hypothetical protein [Bifidobacterium callitrichidarum]|uniref:Histidine kinase n=1 Tax=Bifidobacterium callitrichidarum TaxID=2052941 RepID=A0A2U2N4V9_9BIFI|nr:hypothetical protein [Bifidobacterium callitrichidarum]PWG64009.1 hypothetical protein DF196_09820 [Bifidobacterium callitrichidarum]